MTWPAMLFYRAWLLRERRSDRLRLLWGVIVVVQNHEEFGGAIAASLDDNGLEVVLRARQPPPDFLEAFNAARAEYCTTLAHDQRNA